MKKIFFGAAAALFMLACNDDKKETKVATTDTSATSAKTDTVIAASMPEKPMDSAAMMKAWQEYMTPGDEHKMLAKSNGKWTEETKMWMSPDAPPEVMTGTIENSMSLNGLYQTGIHKGLYNGMPFEGRSTVGYNKAAKKYQSTWIDNMGSGMMTMEGTWDDASKMLVMKGMETDPMSGKDIPVRETLTMPDEHTQLMEMFHTVGGKETKVMEIKMMRKG